MMNRKDELEEENRYPALGLEGVAPSWKSYLGGREKITVKEVLLQGKNCDQ